MSQEFVQLVGAWVGGRKDNAAPTSSPQPASTSPQTTASARCWAQTGDAFFPVSEVRDSLPPGVYRCNHSNQGPYMERMPIVVDNLLHLPDGTVEVVLAEFRKFWTLQQNFHQRGFTYKRGLLLWGPPGSGKTSAIWQMAEHIVLDQKGIVVFVENPDLAAVCISVIRRIEPQRRMIAVMEDLDALVRQHGEHGFLALLDGETQTANVVHVATTNYPQMLDKRFVDRPSRFDTIMKVDMPSAKAREVYLRAKEPSLDSATLQRWVKRTKDYSIAHLREVIVACRCFEQPEDKVFKRLDSMRTINISSDGMAMPPGFGLGRLVADGDGD